MSLREYDLNLLVVLEAILTERSVTRAARRLHLTQPAVSQALSRARDLFEDILLIRDGTGMTPTSRARKLLPKLTQALSGIEDVLRPSRFDPASAEEDFVIAGGDLAEIVILPDVIAQIARQAPKCRIIVRSVEGQPIDHTIDLAIVGNPAPTGPFRSCDIYEEHFVVLARHDHPILKFPLSAEVFAATPQALVSPTGQGMSGPVDTALERLGLARRVALSLTRFATLPRILAATDMVAAVPSRFAMVPEVMAICGVCPLPFESPRVMMHLLWHRARDNDGAHKWLREMIVAGSYHPS